MMEEFCETILVLTFLIITFIFVLFVVLFSSCACLCGGVVAMLS